MAYVQNIRSTNHVAEGFAGFVKSLSDRVARYKVYRATFRELAELSDRDLSDLGLHRSGIRALAHEAAYGK